MEQEFDVEIKEVLSRVQKVKAESLDDAINKAMDMHLRLERHQRESRKRQERLCQRLVKIKLDK